MTVVDLSEWAEFNSDAIVHFIAGVFWKSAIWPSDGRRNAARIELGPYAEKVRAFLLGEQVLPDGVGIQLHVARYSSNLMGWAVFPLTYRIDGARWHEFRLPGMLCQMTVGEPTRGLAEHFDVRSGRVTLFDLDTYSRRQARQLFSKPLGLAP